MPGTSPSFQPSPNDAPAGRLFLVPTYAFPTTVLTRHSSRPTGLHLVPFPAAGREARRVETTSRAAFVWRRAVRCLPIL